MEIQVDKANLLKALGLVGSVTSSKTNTLPILGNVLIQTQGSDGVKLTGTDLEVGISTLIPAVVEKEGSITVPAKKIHDIVRELRGGDVSISVSKNNAVNIRSGKSFFKVMGLAEDDFPKMPEIKESEGVELEQALFKESLSLTVFAISSDETRYVLNGIMISIKGEDARFVATDGRRLAFIKKEIGKNKKSFEMIIPSKAVYELLKILNWEGTLMMYPTKSQVVFRVGETVLSSRLIEGHFPNYEQVIPKEEKTLSSANREDFLQAVRRTALLTSADSPAVKLDFLKDKILVSSRSPNLGEAREELAAQINGEELAIGFNPNYLLDVLKNLDVDEIQFSLSDPDKPGLVKGKDGYLYVIMPMQLN